MRNLIAIFLFLVLSGKSLIFPSPVLAQVYSKDLGEKNMHGLTALAQTLQELANPYSVVCFAAHLDDPDYNTLAYYRFKYGARIGIVFATRGESGAEAAEMLQDEKLGLARTRQALRICHTLGADAYFLNLRDFGIAKSADEVLTQWKKEEIEKKMVEAIRRLRPDVMITSHNGKSGDGYQQVISQMLHKAFTLAGNSQFITPTASDAWQARRFYINTDFGDSDTFINLFESNQLLGNDYSELELFNSLAKQRVQGMEKRYYKLVLSTVGEKPSYGASFFDGFTLPEKLAKSITPPLIKNRPLRETVIDRSSLMPVLIENLVEKRAEGSVESLRERYGTEFFRVVRYIELLERAITLVLGINCELHLPDKTIVQGEALSADLVFHNGSNQPLSMVFHSPETLSPLNNKVGFHKSEVRTVSPYSKVVEHLHYPTQTDIPLTIPHAKQLYSEQFFPASLLRLSQEPFGWKIVAYAEINLGPATLFLPAIQKYEVVAPVELSVTPSFAFVKDWSETRTVEVRVRVRNRTRGSLKGVLWVVSLALTNETYEPLHLRFAREDEEVALQLKLKLPIIKPPLSPDILIEFRGEKPASPEALAAVKIAVTTMDCRVGENLKVGYIAQPESSLPSALAVLNVENKGLRVEDLGLGQHGLRADLNPNRVCGDLSTFHSIIVDALAYSALPDLLDKNSCLLAYVQGGGNLIVLYQRPQFWDFIFNRSLFSPFPLALSGDHLTNERSLVKLLNTEHPLLIKPNLISENDFTDWSRNRAFFLPRHWTTDYVALLESAEAGEEMRKGLLLVARYEAGSFIYTSLDLPKQLTEGNPGAYRLLANMISLPKILKPQQDR